MTAVVIKRKTAFKETRTACLAGNPEQDSGDTSCCPHRGTVDVHSMQNLVESCSIVNYRERSHVCQTKSIEKILKKARREDA